MTAAMTVAEAIAAQRRNPGLQPALEVSQPVPTGTPAPAPVPVGPGPKRKPNKPAAKPRRLPEHVEQAFQAADAAVARELGLPSGLGRLYRLVVAYDRRAGALRQLARVRGVGDDQGLIVRALEIAAQADQGRAETIRRRLRTVTTSSRTTKAQSTEQQPQNAIHTHASRSSGAVVQ